MVRRRISEAQRWQIIGMHTTGMSFKAIGRQMGYHYTVVSRLVRKHTQTNNVKDLPRSGRPRVTSDRDYRALQDLVRRMPIATSPILKQHWLPNRRLSTRTVRNHLKSAGLKSRSHYTSTVGRPTSTITFGMVLSMTWLEFKDMTQDPLVRREAVSASCNRRPMRVWRHKNTTCSRNIQPTVPYSGGVQHAQHVLARNHCGPKSVKSRKCR